MLTRRGTALWTCALMTALVSPLAGSQTRSEDIRSASIDELKAAYLACDHATLNRAMLGLEAMYCSAVYEELKRRAFGGDFEKLLDWSRTQVSVPAS